jgi:hypothetical protein
MRYADAIEYINAEGSACSGKENLLNVSKTYTDSLGEFESIIVLAA